MDGGGIAAFGKHVASKLDIGEVNPSWSYWVDVSVGNDGAIADYAGVEPENIVLGAGADDLILLCARAFASPARSSNWIANSWWRSSEISPSKASRAVANGVASAGTSDSTRIDVSSLCTTSPCAAWRISSSIAGWIWTAVSFTISHWVAAGSGKKFDRARMEELLAGLSNRIFLLNNVHEDGTEVFQTRWAMSYLCGPLTRTQIKTLMADRKSVDAPPSEKAPVASQRTSNVAATPQAAAAAPAPEISRQPVLAPEIKQYFIPLRTNPASDSTLLYSPMLLAMAEIRYSDKKSLDVTQQVALLAPISDGPVAVDWNNAQAVDLAVDDLEQSGQENARFSELASVAAKAKSYDGWSKDFAAWLYRNQKLELLESPTIDLASNPGETERDFRIRLQQLAREQRDQAVEKLRQQYAPKFAALEERRRRAEQAVAREAEQSKNQKVQTAISFGATLLSSFMGRKAVSWSTLGRATTAARGVSRSMKEADDVNRAQESVEAVSGQAADLDAQFKTETESLEKSFDPQTEQFEKISLKPTKANIAVKLITLAWAPYLKDSKNQSTPAWQ